MLNKKALMLTIGITAFVIVTVGGVIAAYAQTQSGTDRTMTAEDMLNDPAVQAVLNEREAAYQRLLDEANQRLAEAETPTPTTEPAQQEYPISVGLAVALAQDALGGGTLLRNVELVNFNGRVAYELIMDRGKVYVDATSGAILFNSAASASFASASGSSRDYEHEDEHDDDDD